MGSHRLFAEIVRAVKKMYLPGLFLQIFALLIALSYYFWPASRGVFKVAEGFKVQSDRMLFCPDACCAQQRKRGTG